jgi:mono/diheme cytochrome c family protein
MNNTVRAVHLGLLVLALHLLVFGGPRPAHAQESGSGSQPAATDTSWFAKYHPAAGDTLLPSTYEGWKQFQLNCSRCHGQDAEGTSFAPSLVQALGKGGPVSTEAAFLQIACNGVPGTGMPSWCKLGLGTDKLREIYLYVSGRANGTIDPGRPAERENSSAAAR